MSHFSPTYCHVYCLQHLWEYWERKCAHFFVCLCVWLCVWVLRGVFLTRALPLTESIQTSPCSQETSWISLFLGMKWHLDWPRLHFPQGHVDLVTIQPLNSTPCQTSQQDKVIIEFLAFTLTLSLSSFFLHTLIDAANVRSKDGKVGFSCLNFPHSVSDKNTLHSKFPKCKISQNMSICIPKTIITKGWIKRVEVKKQNKLLC